MNSGANGHGGTRTRPKQMTCQLLTSSRHLNSLLVLEEGTSYAVNTNETCTKYMCELCYFNRKKWPENVREITWLLNFYSKLIMTDAFFQNGRFLGYVLRITRPFGILPHDSLLVRTTLMFLRLRGWRTLNINSSFLSFLTE